MTCHVLRRVIPGISYSEIQYSSCRFVTLTALVGLVVGGWEEDFPLCRIFVTL